MVFNLAAACVAPGGGQWEPAKGEALGPDQSLSVSWRLSIDFSGLWRKSVRDVAVA